MQEQFDWALHLGVNSVVLPDLTPVVDMRLAKCALHLASLLAGGFHTQQLLVPVPFLMGLHNLHSPQQRRAVAHRQLWDGADDSVLVWNQFKLLTVHHCRIHCLLDLSMDDILNSFGYGEAEGDAEDAPTEEAFRVSCRALRAYTERWGAEQLKGVVLSTHLFHANDGGFPVLPKEHQLVLAILLRFCSLVSFKGPPSITGSFTAYIQYVDHIRRTSTEVIEWCCGIPKAPAATAASSTDDAEGNQNKRAKVSGDAAAAAAALDLAQREAYSESFTAAYRDALQMPLQPLADNLENCTYETFERDPAKYQKYQEAAAKGLVHMSNLRGGVAAGSVRVAVVGAGRGPLVACVLRASAEVGVAVSVFAVEKNKNAVVTLHHRKQKEGWENVTIVHSDMRVWVPSTGPNTVDMVVSELLGSWGDNELSPECLDHCLARCLSVRRAGSAEAEAGACPRVYDGISIPASYTSFLAPLSTSRLWMSARDVALPGARDKDVTVCSRCCAVCVFAMVL